MALYEERAPQVMNATLAMGMPPSTMAAMAHEYAIASAHAHARTHAHTLTHTGATHTTAQIGGPTHPGPHGHAHAATNGHAHGGPHAPTHAALGHAPTAHALSLTHTHAHTHTGAYAQEPVTHAAAPAPRQSSGSGTSRKPNVNFGCPMCPFMQTRQNVQRHINKHHAADVPPEARDRFLREGACALILAPDRVSRVEMCLACDCIPANHNDAQRARCIRRWETGQPPVDKRNFGARRNGGAAGAQRSGAAEDRDGAELTGEDADDGDAPTVQSANSRGDGEPDRSDEELGQRGAAVGPSAPRGKGSAAAPGKRSASASRAGLDARDVAGMSGAFRAAGPLKQPRVVSRGDSSAALAPLRDTGMPFCPPVPLTGADDDLHSLDMSFPWELVSAGMQAAIQNGDFTSTATGALQAPGSVVSAGQLESPPTDTVILHVSVPQSVIASLSSRVLFLQPGERLLTSALLMIDGTGAVSLVGDGMAIGTTQLQSMRPIPAPPGAPAATTQRGSPASELSFAAPPAPQ